MNTSDSLQALRRANPRNGTDFAQSVERVAEALRTQLASDAPAVQHVRARPRRLVHISAVGTLLAAAAAAVALLTVGSAGENATAAVKKAAAVTAMSARQSGTAVVRITHKGELWAGSTIRWSDGDLAVSGDTPQRPGRGLLLVDGVVYGFEDGGWVIFGSPKNIDPGSGTTPDEYLAAVREDAGGVTLTRITGGMTAPAARRLDGSTVYRGTVPAGLIARESRFKGGRPIRVLPFGYVAHGEAADPDAPLDVAITVGANAVIRVIDVTWGTWRYTVTYTDLGTTARLVAPASARPLREWRPGR